MRVRRYETVFVLRPDLEESELRETVEKFESVILRQEGTLIKREDWGIRKLAYDVQRFSKGYYVLLDYVGPTSLIGELERTMKINERVMKFLTVKKADRVDMEAIEKEKAEVEKRRREEAAKRAASREVPREGSPGAEERREAAPEDADVKGEVVEGQAEADAGGTGGGEPSPGEDEEDEETEDEP